LALRKLNKIAELLSPFFYQVVDVLLSKLNASQYSSKMSTAISQWEMM
jgi:hypothetical protein